MQTYIPQPLKEVMHECLNALSEAEKGVIQQLYYQHKKYKTIANSQNVKADKITRWMLGNCIS